MPPGAGSIFYCEKVCLMCRVGFYFTALRIVFYFAVLVFYFYIAVFAHLNLRITILHFPIVAHHIIFYFPALVIAYPFVGAATVQVFQAAILHARCTYRIPHRVIVVITSIHFVRAFIYIAPNWFVGCFVI